MLDWPDILPDRASLNLSRPHRGTYNFIVVRLCLGQFRPVLGLIDSLGQWDNSMRFRVSFIIIQSSSEEHWARALNGQLGKHLNIPEFIQRMQSLPSSKIPNYLRKKDPVLTNARFHLDSFIAPPKLLRLSVSTARNVYFTAHLTVIYVSTDKLECFSYFRMQWDYQWGALHQLRGQQSQELPEQAQLQRRRGPHPLQLRLVSQALKWWVISGHGSETDVRPRVAEILREPL